MKYMKHRLNRLLSTVFALALVASLLPLSGWQAEARAVSPIARVAGTQAETVATPDSTRQDARKISGESQKYQPRHLLADAVKRLQRAEAGERLSLAAEDFLQTDVYYEALNEDEKRLYETAAQVSATFQPYASSEEYFNAAKSSGPAEVSLADDISSGRVGVAEMSRAYTKDEYRDLFRMALRAFHCDHPYDLSHYLFRTSYVFKGSRVYIALCRYSNAEDFDYQAWEASLVEFEDKALTELVSDSRFDQTQPAIMEYLVHDYICGRVKYDASKPDANTIRWYKIKTAYGPMVENSGVCIGISLMAKILLDDLGVPTYIVTSDTHAWNMVCIDGEYYELDCTWDLDGGKGIKYKYFNRTTTELTELDTSGAHVREADSTHLPTANGTKYTYEAVCDLLKIQAEANQDHNKDPNYSGDDYVDESTDGEVYPCIENYGKDGLIYDLYSEGYAACKAAAGNPKKIDIPDYVTYTDDEGNEYNYEVLAVDKGAFAHCNKLKTAYLAGTIMLIDKKAFFNCKKLKKIVLWSVEDLVLVDSNAFKGIEKNAVFTIYADSNTFAEAKEMIKSAGAPKKAKFKRATI
ncbi:MAG: leucine-rich repeat protein [Eubacterium sp.]|nr:leucine-rich repeat protein [Eubacterium sp.]